VRKASAIQKEAMEIETVQDLTGVFESIASAQVAKVKTKVELAKEFFELLWKLYTSIRIDPNSRITTKMMQSKNSRKVYVIISSETGLSGDIDQRLVETMLKNYNYSDTDVVVIGSHGQAQLAQRGVPIIRFFKVPESDTYIDVSPVIDAIENYSKITVYYEEYISLGVQGIKSIDLYSSIQNMTKEADERQDLITTNETIFEPSLDEIAELMERIMMTLAFEQSILESNLAQSASRFNAMALAKRRAWELLKLYELEYHRSRRSESDKRLHEILIGLKKKKHSKGSL
jgi:F-type H+-transporting ATPase subunit gamma